MLHLNADIYFDNATTSWPKSRVVADALAEALTIQGSSQRGLDRMVSHEVEGARKALAQFFSVNDTSRVVFQPSATQALNLVISEVVTAGAHIYVSRSEHNAVTRPLFYYAEQRNAQVSWIPVDSQGLVDLKFIAEVLGEARADVIICQQGSNVTGALQPISEIALLIKEQTSQEKPIRFIVDGAQAGGHCAVNLSNESGIDAWVCSGHKGLGGPKGIGVLILGPTFRPKPLIFGGTGSGDYFYDAADCELPLSLEAGTESLPLIKGLQAAVGELDQRELSRRIEQEQYLCTQLLEGLAKIEGLTLYGPNAESERLPIVSFSLAGKRADEVSFELAQRFKIASRPGLHCAPALHEALGTKELGGLVRFGLSAANDALEVTKVVQAVKMITAGL